MGKKAEAIIRAIDKALEEVEYLGDPEVTKWAMNAMYAPWYAKEVLTALRVEILDILEG